MSLSKATVGGFTWYSRMVKENSPDPDNLDYKALLQKYISGVPWEEVVKEMDRKVLESGA